MMSQYVEPCELEGSGANAKDEDAEKVRLERMNMKRDERIGWGD